MRIWLFGAILALVLLSATHGASFDVSVSPSAINSTTNATLNFTVSNTDPIYNITNVSISLPSGFSYNSGTNGTTVTSVSFTSIEWTNTTPEGIVGNGTSQYFWITVLIPSATGSYNITVTTKDNQSQIVQKNTTVTLSDKTLPAVTLSSPANGSQTSSTSATFSCSSTDNVGLKNTTLWGNFDGTWKAISTGDLSGTSQSTNFVYSTLVQGTFNWNCFTYDNSSNSAFASQNFTIVVNTSNVSAFSLVFVSPTPANNSHVNKTWIYFNVTTNHDSVNATLEFNSTNYTMLLPPNASNNRTWYYNLSNLTNGASYSFMVYSTVNSTTSNFTEKRIVFIDTTNPTATLTINQSLVYSGDVVGITCAMTDSNPSSVTLNVTGPVSVQNSAKVSNLTLVLGASQTIPGVFTASCTVSDVAGNTYATNRTLSVFSKQTSNQWSTTVNVTPNTIFNVVVTNPSLEVTKISINSNVQIVADLQVAKLASKPSGISDPPAESVYGYFDISLSNQNIQSAAIEFKVPRSWFESNTVDEKTIVLYRYANGWQSLSTQKLREDSTNYYFSANTQGFSFFAIGGKKIVVQNVTNQTNQTVPPESGGSSTLLIVIVVILVMLGGIGYYLYQKGYLYMLEIPSKR